MTFKELRVSNGLTQVQMAEMLGISQKSISMIEIGERKPSPRVIKRIKAAFKLSANEMWEILYGEEV